MAAMISGNRIDRSIFSKNWAMFLVWGIALAVLGGLCIWSSTIATLVSVVFLGTLIMLSGIVIIFDTFTFWRRKGHGFALHLLMGILYLVVGGMLIESPMLGSMSITLVLGIFYLVIGIIRVIASASLRVPRWGWGFFNGVISVLIGVLILSSWPASSLFIIGLFIGIDLLFAGWAYIMAALTARALRKA
jgi:uncharacterized membrane protein HdeD (DUF308 family)